jgi:hypothetical protein
MQRVHAVCHEMKMESTRTKQCDVDEDILKVDADEPPSVYRRLVLPALRFPEKRCFGYNREKREDESQRASR